MHFTVLYFKENTTLEDLESSYSDVSDFLTNFSATISCMSNIGPGLNLIGPMSNFAIYSPASKILLSLLMLVGRLEIFPILLLFTPRTWKKS